MLVHFSLYHSMLMSLKWQFFFQYHQGWHLLVPYGRPAAKRFGWLSLKETRCGEGTIFNNVRKMQACSPDTSFGLCEWLKNITPDSHCLCMRNQMGYKYCPWTVYLSVPGHRQSLQHNLLLLPTTHGNTTLCSSQIQCSEELVTLSRVTLHFDSPGLSQFMPIFLA